MSDRMELDDDRDAVEQGTSTGEASTGDDGQRRQPKQERVDLTKLDEFKAWQANADRRVAAAEYAANQAGQRAAQLEQTYHQQLMAGMNDQQKIVYENRLLKQQMTEVQRQRELDAFAIQRQRDLEEIVRETGIAIEEIESAPNVHVAWQIGNKFFKEKGPGKRSRNQEDDIDLDDADDTVDLGGGKPSGKASGYQKQYDEYRKSFDFDKAFEVMAKSARAGVTIREW